MIAWFVGQLSLKPVTARGAQILSHLQQNLEGFKSNPRNSPRPNSVAGATKLGKGERRGGTRRWVVEQGFTESGAPAKERERSPPANDSAQHRPAQSQSSRNLRKSAENRKRGGLIRRLNTDSRRFRKADLGWPFEVESRLRSKPMIAWFVGQLSLKPVTARGAQILSHLQQNLEGFKSNPRNSPRPNSVAGATKLGKGERRGGTRRWVVEQGFTESGAPAKERGKSPPANGSAERHPTQGQSSRNRRKSARV